MRSWHTLRHTTISQSFDEWISAFGVSFHVASRQPVPTGGLREFQRRFEQEPREHGRQGHTREGTLCPF